MKERSEVDYSTHTRDTKNNLIPDHQLFFEIFSSSLSDDFKKKLFPESLPPARALSSIDFKGAEKRRISLYEKYTQSRYFTANSFACQLEIDYSNSFTRKPLKNEISEQTHLVNNLKKLADLFRGKPSDEWTYDEEKLLVEELIAQDRLNFLQKAKDLDGEGFKNSTDGYAQRVFVYSTLHQTYLYFGDGPNEKGKNSGRGIPTLAAKIANILFPDDRILSPRDVSTIYSRASGNFAKAHKGFL